MFHHRKREWGILSWSSLFEPPTTKVSTDNLSNSQKTLDRLSCILHAFVKGYQGYKSNFGFRVSFDRESRRNSKIRFCICRKKHTHNFLNVSEANFKVLYDIAQRLSERRSLEVDLLRLNGFQSYYKFTWEKKWLTYAVSRAAWNITHSPVGQLSWPHQ